MPATPRFAVVAFAGMLLWLGALATVAPARAGERAGAPAGRLVDTPLCGVDAPTFRAIARERPAIGSVRFPGGARFGFLVAAPCRPAARPFEV